jgi:hypothetical protein
MRSEKGTLNKFEQNIELGFANFVLASVCLPMARIRRHRMCRYCGKLVFFMHPYSESAS